VRIFSSNIKRMYLFNFLLNMHFVAGVLVPFMTQWGNISFSQIMLLQSFFMISIFALEVPTGAVADYLGRKTSLILSAIVHSLAALVYASYPSFYVFMLGEFLWALGAALLSGADSAMVYDTLKTEGGEIESKSIFGRMQSSMLAAIMISAPMGSMIAATVGLRYSMMMLSLPCFLAAIVGLSLEEPAIFTEKKEKNYLGTIREGFSYFRHHRVLRILAFDSIFIGNLLFMIIWMYQPMLTELKVSIFFFGFVSAGMTLTEIGILNNFARIENFLGSKRRYILFSAILPGMGMILISINSLVPITVILIFIVGGFGLTRVTLYQSYMNKYIDSHNRATVLSTISMISVLVRSVSYPIYGLLIEWSLRNTFLMIGILALAFALISRVREEHLID